MILNTKEGIPMNKIQTSYVCSYCSINNKFIFIDCQSKSSMQKKKRIKKIKGMELQEKEGQLLETINAKSEHTSI